MTKSDSSLEVKSLQANLKQRSVQSGLIAVAAQPIKLVIGIGSTMVLARLLMPADFGLLAMVQPLLSLVDSLSNLGLETATVQRQELNHDEASAVFWLSLKVNACVIGLMLLAGPLIAYFYQQPELTPMVLCLAIGVTSLCLSFQHMSLLKRQMRFELITKIEVVALAAGAMVAIASAWMGWGYWALALQLTVFQTVKGIAYWLYCDWRPKRLSRATYRQTDLRSTLSYGLHLTGFRCISRVGMKMDRVLLGYFGGASTLGFYSMAYQWAYFPFWQVYYPLFDVAVSSFSRSLADPACYRLYCRRGLLLIFAVCLPALAGLFVVAREVTLFMLGEQWLEMVPLFRILIVAVFIGTIYRVTKWIYVSSGETQHQFRWSLIHTPVMILAIAIGVHWGALGTAIGYTTGMCLLSYPSVLHCVQKTPVTLGDFWSAFWRPGTAAILAAMLLTAARLGMPQMPSLLLTLCFQGLIYSSSYVVFLLILPGGYAEAKDIMMELKKTRRLD